MAQAQKPQSQALIRIRRRRRRAAIQRATALTLCLGIAIGAYWFWGQFPSPPEASEPTRNVAAAPPVEPSRSATLPPLEASDAFLRELAKPHPASPEWARFLAGDHLVRSATVAVIRVGDGASPGPALAPLRQGVPFRVIERDGKIFVDPESYRRYDSLVATVETTSALDLARLYRLLRPLFEEAYAKEGFPDRDFDLALAVSIEELWATPVVEGDIELVPAAPNYAFRDPALEDLSGAQKQMLRLGPENQKRLRKQLAAFAQKLDLPARLD